MTLQKITIDNSVKYLPQSAQTQSISGDVQTNTIRIISLPPKHKKNCHKTMKNSLKITYQHKNLVLLKEF